MPNTPLNIQSVTPYSIRGIQPAAIRVVGRGSNVLFSIDDSLPFDVAERRLREYLSQCRALFSSGTVSVNVGRRILAPAQLAAIKAILSRETGLTVTQYYCPPGVLAAALAGPESRRALPSPPASIAPVHLVDYVDLSDFPEFNALPPSGDPPPKHQVNVDVGPTRRTPPERPIPPVPGETTAPPLAELPLQLSMVLDGLECDPYQPHVVPPCLTSPRQEEDPAAYPLTPGPVPQTSTENEGSAQANHPHPVPPSAAADVPAHSRATNALIIKHTCRSGEVVQYPGDVVVFGDVNPGAHIVAGGDIIVLGTLRGMAHAGADGNLKATILALNLESHRLQIGSCVGERPRGAGKFRGGGQPRSAEADPQIAFLRPGRFSRTIFVAPFQRRREEYHGGVPYEG